METVKTNPILRHWRIIAVSLIIYDIGSVFFAYLLALILRFEGKFDAIPQEYLTECWQYIPWYMGGACVLYALFGLYHCIWRFVGFNILVQCGMAVLTGTVLNFVTTRCFYKPLPASVYALGFFFQLVLLILSRFLRRIIYSYQQKLFGRSQKKRGMLIGGGAAGELLLRDIQTNSSSNVEICCIIDDNSYKKGCRLNNIRIVGNRDTVKHYAEKYRIEEILIAIPSLSKTEMKKILGICQETGCKVRTLPSLSQLVNDEVNLSRLHAITIEDLLGRAPIVINNSQILEKLKDRVVLVTGGGGSIGSELCRQIACHSPKQLIIFDIYENNVYDIEQELRNRHPELNLVTLIGSVRDTNRINNVFATYRPEYVYHAAAHKHVPLMETSPYEAIKNNVIGTYKTALAAMKYGTKRFLLISTDKAVNPTNIMGASKRLCEMVVQTMNTISQSEKYELLAKNISRHAWNNESKPFECPANGVHTDFVAVRFGNVLGSNGSVVPLFQKQIAMGGPVCVTHKEITRFFMTIPEAVSLVIQAGVYASGGEIFVLDMGEPVKIDDLARNLIRLSGLKPDIDIKIEYTGLRPGEKLYEEKLMEEEGLQKTENNLIYIARPLKMDEKEFINEITDLARSVYECKNDIFERVKKLVPNFSHHVE